MTEAKLQEIEQYAAEAKRTYDSMGGEMLLTLVTEVRRLRGALDMITHKRSRNSYEEPLGPYLWSGSNYPDANEVLEAIDKLQRGEEPA